MSDRAPLVSRTPTGLLHGAGEQLFRRPWPASRIDVAITFGSLTTMLGQVAVLFSMNRSMVCSGIAAVMGRVTLFAAVPMLLTALFRWARRCHVCAAQLSKEA
jgi:hypothetical protein